MSKTPLSLFSERLQPLNLSPLWERKIKTVPGSHCVPHVWPYELMRPLLDESTLLIEKKEADRRVLMLENPSLRGSSFIANSLFAGLQIILPGEIAPSHRHSPNALRFVMDGEGAYTSVNGEKVNIFPGDFIVTPNWSWHDHGNLGKSAVVWMDGLDTPFTALFGAHFRENYPDDQFPISKQNGSSFAQFGSNMVPLNKLPEADVNPCSLLHYSFDKTRDALLFLAKDDGTEIDPVHGYKLRYSNPLDGSHPFKTMAAFMQLLPEGFVSKSYRTTENTVFNMAYGSCLVKLKEKTIELKAHDVLVIPSWETFSFEAQKESMIFSFSDRAAQQALGFLREEIFQA
jgi:gentisate 1,2-dioxygenase